MTKIDPKTAQPLGPMRELESEVRFGVVMHGGVSLAVYINGVTEELFILVRSTAPLKAAPTGSTVTLPSLDTLAATDSVYRKVAYLIADQKLLARYRDHLNNPNNLPDPLTVESVQNLGLITAPVESTINHLINYWMNKSQQMSWTARGAHYMLHVRMASQIAYWAQHSRADIQVSVHLIRSFVFGSGQFDPQILNTLICNANIILIKY